MNARNLLANAAAVWSFASPPAETKQKQHDAVRFGVELEGEERAASIARGGSGRVAQFRGGCVEARGPELGALRAMTFHARVRVPAGDWSAPIFSISDDEGLTALQLCGRRVGADPALAVCDSLQHYAEYPGPDGCTHALEFVLGLCGTQDVLTAKREATERQRKSNPDLPPYTPTADLAAGLMRVGVPVQLIGAGDWHDIAARFTGPKLELFVDGVFVDEEWPVGSMRAGRVCRIGAAPHDGVAQFGFNGFIEHLALWTRALSDAEVAILCGGEAVARRREIEILGPEQPSLQYWKPRGHNAGAGDVTCFFDGRRYHAFWLADRRHHQSKWNSGAHQTAHASSADLVHWQHHPLTVPIEEQWFTCGTGTCILHDGRYHFLYGMHTRRIVPISKTVRPELLRMFEAERRYEPIPFDSEKGVPFGLACAVSGDGIHFRKEKETFHAAENGFVFREPESGLFQLIAGSQRFTSTDLRHWTAADLHFLPLGDETPAGNSGECPCYFEWNGWHYIIMGKTGFWMSRRALGPYWKSPTASGEIIAPRWDIYDGLLVPMAAAFHGDRFILAGTLGEIDEFGARQYAGQIIFRELIQHADGMLGMKWPAEMEPASGAALELPFSALTDGVESRGRNVRISSRGEFRYGAFIGVPSRARISMQVNPGPGVRAFGVCLKGAGAYRSGCEVRFEPARRRAQWGRPVNGRPAPDATAAPWTGGDFALQNVEEIGRSFTLDLIIRDDVIDACIAGRRTMVIRRKRLDGDRLFLFADGGAVEFQDVCVKPLLT